jgi:hypothetical protein
MKVHKLYSYGIICIMLSLPFSRVQSAPGYHPGSYYAAHVIRTGGELIRSEESENGYRWEDFSVVRIKGNRIPARIGHGLEVFADVYGMPIGKPATLTVTRPQRTATGETDSRTYTRTQSLYPSDADDVQVFNYTYFFDEPDELVSGEWIIELSYQDTLILRQTFEVYPDPS